MDLPLKSSKFRVQKWTRNSSEYNRSILKSHPFKIPSFAECQESLL
jgi:hypothetical protein